MAVDYFTKWVEAEVLASITHAKIKEFIYKNIVCQYEVPHTIVSNNGTQFDCNEFKEFHDDLQMKKVFSLDAQPQANGQIKAMNKKIKHNLKTKLENLKGRWAYDLPEVLWAYRTTVISTTGETPFLLAYKFEVMVLIELSTGSLRRDNFDLEQNLILQRRKLDFLEEKWRDSQLWITEYQRLIARYFNSRVKRRGDFKTETSSLEEFCTTKGP